MRKKKLSKKQKEILEKGREKAAKNLLREKGYTVSKKKKGGGGS